MTLMIEQLALVIVGIIIGSVLGVEYSLWRAGRKLKHYEELLMSFLGIDSSIFKKLSREGKIKRITKAIKELWELASPQIPTPPPSQISTLSGNEFFVPKCPQCGFAGVPVKGEPGAMVQGVCPRHGVFAVLIPKTSEKEEKKE